MSISVSSNFLRIGNTIDSIINYYGSYYPVLYGDNKGITLGPSNVNYFGFLEKLS